MILPEVYKLYNEKNQSVPVTTAELIRKAEMEIIESGVTETELIGRASDKIVAFLEQHFPSVSKIAVVVGSGNNGSDGLMTALKLLDNGIKCDVFVSSLSPNGENARLREALIEKGFLLSPAINGFSGYELILDCLFGIGLSREITGEHAEIIEKINRSCAIKVSVDIPSGLSADTGEPLGACVAADYTIALGAIKTGHVLGYGFNYCGKITVGEIGLNVPSVAIISGENDCEIKRRNPVSHKGNYGKISVIGGSDNMPGAPLMSYESAVASSRSGAGLVRLCVGESEKCAYKSRITEQTLFYLPDNGGFISFCPDKLDEIMAWSDIIAIGMGMGSNPDLPQIIGYIAKNYTKILVIDADGLNALALNLKIIKGHACKIILTPHVGEFGRLCPGVKQFDIEKIKGFAKEHAVTVAVKSATTVITDGNEIIINVTGTPAMAKGGSGDVLAGMVSAFAVNNSPVKATALACYYFGKCGSLASRRMESEVSILGRDIIIEQRNLFD